MQLNDSWILKYTKLYVTPLVYQKLTYLPVGSTDKLQSMSPRNQNLKLLQLMFFFTNWSRHFTYIFLPFSLLTKVIKKICRDEATGILVLPACSTQPWYPQALELSGNVPLKIRPNLTNLILPQDKETVHPLAEKLTLHVIKFNTMVD